MNTRIVLQHGLRIARVERTRTRRQLGRSSALRAVIVVGVLAFSIVAGFRAYTVGVALRTEGAALPVGVLRVATAVGFLGVLVGVSQRTSRIRERLDTDHLLTTVPAREVVVGIVLAVSSRFALRMSLVTLGVAIGFAIGAQSLPSVVTIVFAVCGFVVFTALCGVALSFGIELLTTRSVRFRRYKNALIATVFFLLVFLLPFGDALIAVESVTAWVAVAPTAWFVDLGVLGASVGHASLLRGVGALGILVVGIPSLTVVTTALATRVWETEPVSATMIHRSRSLIGDGLAEQVFATRVSRPVLTVARKRWLQERRLPRGLFSVSFLVVVLLPGVFLPALAAGEVPGISLLLLVVTISVGVGLAVGLEPIGTEYSSLPMTLTTISGTQFVRGELLAGLSLGASVLLVGTFLLGVGSPLGVLETMLIVVAGIGVCTCSVVLSAAVGMGVAYRDLAPAPLPFTSATIYAEIGWASFVRLSVVLVLLGVVCLPAVAGYSVAFFEPGTVLGIPIAIVRVGSLLLTAMLSVGVSIVAYRRAVRLYDQYTLP